MAVSGWEPQEQWGFVPVGRNKEINPPWAENMCKIRAERTRREMEDKIEKWKTK